MHSQLLEIQQCGRLMNKIISADIEGILVNDELISLFAKGLGIEVPQNDDFYTPSIARDKYIDTIFKAFSMPINMDDFSEVAEGVNNIRRTVQNLYEALAQLKALKAHSDNMSQQSFLEFGEKFVTLERTIHLLLAETARGAFDMEVLQKGMSLESALILFSDSQLLDAFEKDHKEFLNAVYNNKRFDGHIDKDIEPYMSDSDRRSIIERDLKHVMNVTDDLVSISITQNEDVAKVAYLFGIPNPSIKNIVISDPEFSSKTSSIYQRKDNNVNTTKQIKTFINNLRQAMDMNGRDMDSVNYRIIRLSDIGRSASKVAESGFEVLDYIKNGKKLFSESMTTADMSRSLYEFCDGLYDQIEEYFQKNGSSSSLSDLASGTVASMLRANENLNVDFIEEEYLYNQQKMTQASQSVAKKGPSAVDLRALNDDIKRVRDLGEKLKNSKNFDVYVCGETIDTKIKELAEALNQAKPEQVDRVKRELETLQLQIVVKMNDKFIPVARNEINNIMDVLSEEPRVFQDEPPVLNKNSIQPSYNDYISGLKGVSEDVKKYTEKYGSVLSDILLEFDTDKILSIAEAYAKQENINNNLNKALQAQFDTYSYSAPNK